MDRDRDVSLFSLLLSWFCLWREKGTNFEETREKKKTLLSFPQDNIVVKSQSAGLLWEQQTASAASDDDDDDEEQEDDDDDDDEEEDNTFSSSRVSSVFLFLDHFRVWRTTTIPTTTTTTTTTTETRLPNGEVIELNDGNFDKYVNKGTAEQLPVIIDVYATWCVHCKQLEPVWRELARVTIEVYVGKIDGEKERALANRLSANKGFPTIILLHQNKMRFYSGERSSRLTHFCRKG